MVAPFHYTRSQIEKLGNAIIYLSSNMPDLSKTKLLKLLYLIEEISIKKYGFPFFNIRFDVWKLGPVSKDVYLELSDTPDLLHLFIEVDKSADTTFIRHKKDFNDDEFSDNDMGVLDYVVTHFKNAPANYLVNLTHQKHSAWHQTALRYGLLEYFDAGQLTTTDIEIDFTTLFDGDDTKKAFYLENKAIFSFRDLLKA